MNKSLLLRSKLGTHFGGFGTPIPIHDENESWKNISVHDVRLPHDAHSNKELERIQRELSGPVITYYISELENKK